MYTSSLSIAHYFAYGSNMNPERMKARGIHFVDAKAGRLPGFGLRFNKQASGKQNIAYANIAYAPNDCVEGVLYELENINDIQLMDPFEGSPYRYSREVFSVADGKNQPVSAWVYVANRAMLADGLLPERQYLNHLLAGRQWHSDSYHQWLQSHPCIETDPAINKNALNGLMFNV